MSIMTETPAQGSLDTRKKTSKTLLVAYAGVFTALYILLSYFGSLVFGPQLRGSDAHLYRALLMAVLAWRLRSPGGPTLMGIVSGLLLLGIPAPASFLYLPGGLAAGLTYDLLMRGGNYSSNSRKSSRVIFGSVISGLAEAIIVTSGFFAIGFDFQALVERLVAGGFPTSIWAIWLYAVGKNLVFSFIGALIALAMIRKLSPLQRRG